MRLRVDVPAPDRPQGPGELRGVPVDPRAAREPASVGDGTPWDNRPPMPELTTRPEGMVRWFTPGLNVKR